jgi:aerobic-type carbon monoxide dehydrogenase small subunit (CoxS/CutS family)
MAALRVNGVDHPLAGDPERSLLHVLREDLGLTGTKYGCGEGQCGACTVLVDGKVTRSCLTPAGSVSGKAVTTIEGLETGGHLHPLQEAFLAAGALQCGYCTAGMIVAGAGFLSENPDPKDADIVRAMNGNVCRCGTYPRILEAIRAAARVLREGHRG